MWNQHKIVLASNQNYVFYLQLSTQLQRYKRKVCLVPSKACKRKLRVYAPWEREFFRFNLKNMKGFCLFLYFEFLYYNIQWKVLLDCQRKTELIILE